MEDPGIRSERPAHNRSRSTGILKSIIKSTSRTPSPRKRAPTEVQNANNSSGIFQDRPGLGDLLPADHPHAGQAVLGDIQNKSTKSPRKTSESPKKKPGKLTLESWDDKRDTDITPAESALLSPQPRDYFAPKEKENTTPPRSSTTDSYAPIWAQFTSHPNQEISRLQKQGINAKSNVKDEHEKYRPQSGSPVKQQSGRDPVEHDICRRDTKPSIPEPTPGLSRSAAMENIQRPQSTPVTPALASPKKRSKVMAAVAKLNGTATDQPVERQLEGKELDDQFEAVLVSRNIPEHRRPQMRGLDVRIKRDFVKHDQTETSPVDDRDSSSKSVLAQFKSGKGERSARKRAESSADDASFDDDKGSPSKRSRSRSRTFTFSKRSRSNSRPRSLMSLKNLSSSSVNSVGADKSLEARDRPQPAVPEDFTSYLKMEQKPQRVEVGKIHKLRLLLRNETVAWVDTFISCGGMTGLVGLLRRIMEVEWREEHEDLLLHEVLLCLKGLCTTQRALEKLAEVQTTLFPELLKMLFDDEKKGPSEYNTRSIIISLFFTHLAAGSPEQQPSKATTLLIYLSDPAPPESERPAGFIAQMQEKRPYQIWCREITNVTKEVFWIFLHHLNVINAAPCPTPTMPSDTYASRHFPRERPPVPAAPYVGGVEWDATNYLAAHLDLLNGLLASLPSKTERDTVRAELKASGFEKVMGATLRLCKEKFYGAVHDGLRTWVAAAGEDGWEVRDVRMGPPKETRGGSPVKGAPRLELPVLQGGFEAGREEGRGDGWL